MTTVAMSPSRSPSRAFLNKPYYPNLTLRRSSRLLDQPPSPSPQQPSTKRSRRSVAPPPTVPTPTVEPVPSSSKRKADDLSVDDEDDDQSPAMNRRKKRKENALDKQATSLSQMRATIKLKPRPRSSTNKYGTRSAASLPAADTVDSAPTDDSISEQPAPEQPLHSSPPPPVPPKVIDEVTSEVSPCPPPIMPDIIATGETHSAPISIVPSQQDIDMFIPEIPEPPAPVLSPSPASYVTYTDLTPSFPQHQFDDADVPMQSPAPSLLSELHDDFGFSCDPDLDPHALLPAFAHNPPLQDQIDVGSYGNAPPNVHEWNMAERQRQIEEYERQRRETMRAGQRQDRLWIAWTSKKFNYLIEHYGGIGEVRALLKAQIQRADARKAETDPSNKENSADHPSSPSSLTMDANSSLSVQSSFEMYSPESDECDAGDKSDMEDEEDEEEDSDSNADDDMVPEPEVNPNFELPPAPVLSPLKANPCSGRLIVFGTPPFLERRKAWGGDNLLTLAMKTSVDLQQVRPQGRKYSISESSSGELPVLSYSAPPSPYPESPQNSPYPPPPASPYAEPSEPLSPPDFSGELAAGTNSFDDPCIMQAIIASMTPSSMDFNFNWADGMGGTLPEVANQGWQSPVSSSVSSGLESSSPSFPRLSHTLSSSSSTLHSALG